MSALSAGGERDAARGDGDLRDIGARDGGVKRAFGAFAHVLPALDAPRLDRLAVMMLARRAVLDLAREDAALLVVDDAHLGRPPPIT